VIKIRYSTELQPGLHGQAERHGHTTVVKLLPGLTPAQRTATLRRLTQQGRMGIGPGLPAVQLVIALTADRMRTAFGQVGAVVRIHPAGSTVPVMVLFAAAVAFLALSPVSIRIIHQPQVVAGSAFGTAPTGGTEPTGTVPSPDAGPTAPGQEGALHGTGPGQQPADAAGSSAPGTGSTPGSGGVPSSGGGSGPGTTPTPTPVTGPGSSSPPGGTTLTSTAATTPPTAEPTAGLTTGPPATGPSPAPITSPPSTSPVAAPSPTQTAKSGGSGGSICLDVGPLGICLSL
jgi:hypothetical protein